MTVKGYFGAVVAAMVISSSAAHAQSNGVPAEFPPASFGGNQFVDSNGCAFVRAGIAGATNWVPRVSRTRQQLCNFQPTFPGAVANAAPAPIDQNLIINIVPPAAAAAPAPAPRVAAAPAPAAPAPTRGRNVGAPIQTVASITARPAAPVVTRPTAPAPSPRIATAPAPAAAPAAPSVTLAQACEGRFGIQAGFISARTGNPIDCGPAPQAAPIVTAAAVPTVTGPPRMTLAQICEATATTGQRFVDAATGAPISCAPVSAPITIAAAPVVPAAPAGPSIVGAPRAPTTVANAASACAGIPNMGAGGRYAVRCGPQTELPYTEVTSGTVARARVSTSTAPILEIFNPPVPASNPRVSTRAVVPNPPAGFERVWNDGRINPQRGLPAGRTTVRVPAPAAVVAAPTARVSTRTVAPAAVQAPVAASAHRYVQVGSFGDHANADRLIARLNSMGLPTGTGRSGSLKIVAAGPFNDAASLTRALSVVRGLGFNDAYTRN